MNRSAREGKSVKRFERSNGPDIALYKNYLYLYLLQYTICGCTVFGQLTTLLTTAVEGDALHPFRAPAEFMSQNKLFTSVVVAGISNDRWYQSIYPGSLAIGQSILARLLFSVKVNLVIRGRSEAKHNPEIG